ncbi:MAG: CbtA family protein [Salinirussus sp.]
MLADYLERGAAAGVVGGIAYGGYVALVGTPMITHAESFESGSHAAASSVSDAAISIGASVLWGLLLGAAIFGLAWFLLEPRLPGRADTQAFLLAGAGFMTISGAPWLVLPPQPPGIESALSTTVRLGLYGIMVLAGALACIAGVWLYNRLEAWNRAIRALAGIAPLGLLLVAPVLAPANTSTGPAPDSLVAAFRWMTVFGQVFLWGVMAAAAAWIERRLQIDAAPSQRP